MKNKKLTILLLGMLILGAGAGSGLLSVVQGGPSAKVEASTLQQGAPPPVPTGGVPAQAVSPN